MRRLALPFALVLLLAACGGGSSGGTTTESGATTAASGGSGATLVGTVGPGYTITLTRDGRPVHSLAPGSYTFEITDKATIHGFTLEQEEGGDYEQDLTTVPDQGTQTVMVQLTKGEWKFYCPPHESQMNGTFTVG